MTNQNSKRDTDITPVSTCPKCKRSFVQASDTNECPYCGARVTHLQAPGPVISPLEIMTQKQATEKIMESLRNKNWDYRTVDGISRETGLRPDSIRAWLNSNPGIALKSSIPDRLGRDLYTFNKPKAKEKNFMRNLRSLVSKTPI